MATEKGAGRSKAHVAALAFVNHYYHVLIYSPQLLYKFYRDCSLVSRQGPNGLMLTGAVVTQPQPQPQITSPDYSGFGFKVEIKTVDSQESHNNGVLVLVSGSITFKKSETRRTFTQTFFLAPQENGYFVLNDIFEFVHEEPHQPIQNLGYIAEQYPTNADPVSETVVVTLAQAQAQAQAQSVVIEQPKTIVEEPANANANANAAVEKVEMRKREDPEGSAGQPQKSQKVSAIEHVHNEGQPAPTPVVTQGALENAAPPAVAVASQKPFKAVSSAQSQVTNSASIPPKLSSASTSVNMTDKSTVEVGVAGYSVFVSNLHAKITPAQVEAEFKKFGAIKPSGVQLKRTQGGGASYAFIEFEEVASVQAAVKAAPIPMGGRQISVRKKRSFTEDEGTRRCGDYSNGGRGNGRINFVNNRIGRVSLTGHAAGLFSTGYESADNQIRNGRIGTQPASGMVG